MDALSRITPPSATASPKNARRLLALFGVMAVSAGIAWAGLAHAGVGEWIATNIIGPIIILLVGFVGQLLLIMVGVLISIAKYNDFVNSTAVANGWVIVRDVTNMFFILVLLVLAFGTMLGVESYSYKNRMLPRLLIMAVVINFSRTICGLLIDFGQVVMLTFVNGFAAAAGGNFVEALKIKEMLEPGERRGGVDGWGLVIAALLALVMVTISLGVVIIMTATLVIRIIYLWLLVILSPIAFFMKAVPGGKASGYYAEWWSMFTSNIVTGPILAFFLWLSLVSVAAGGVNKNFPSPTGGEGVSNDSISKAFEGNQIQGYIISIGLLLGGVMMAQKAGGAGVGIGKSIATGAGKAVARGAKAVGKGAWDRTGGRVVDAAQERVLSKAVGLPVLGTLAGRRLGSMRAEKAAKGAEASKFISQLKPDEAAKFAKTRVPLALMSTEQKAIQKEALRATLKDKSGKALDEKGNKEYRSMMTSFETLGKDTLDKSVTGDLQELYKKKPGAIVDPSETDPAKIAAQQEAYKNTLKNFSAGDIGKLNPSELTGDAGKMLMSQLSPEKLIKAMDATDNDEVKKTIAGFGGMSDADLKDFASMKPDERLKKFRGQFEGAQEAGKQERPDLIVDRDEQKRVLGSKLDANGDLQGLESNLITTSVMGALAEMKNSGMNVNMPGSFKLDANQLTNNRDMAGQIAIALGDKMKDMPKDIAQALRTGLKESTRATAEQKLAGGIAVKDVFKSLDTKTGTFGKREEKDAFDVAMSKMSAAQAARAAGATGLSDRGGRNELAVSVMSKMNASELQQMAKGGGSNQEVFAAIQAAKGLADADINAEVAKFGSTLPANMPNKNVAIDEFKAEMQQAQKNAQAIMAELKNKNSTLSGDVRSISFNVAPKAAAAAALTAAAPGAVATAAAVAAVALGAKKLNDKRREAGVTWDNLKREAAAAAKAGIREGARAGRSISRNVRR